MKSAKFAVRSILALWLVCCPVLLAWAEEPPVEEGQAEEEKTEPTETRSRLSDKPIPLQIDEVPDRPRLILELGDPFLGSGPLGPEIELPSGAVWRPSFWVFGTLRTAIQTFDNGLPAGPQPNAPNQVSDWANRLDVFGNLKLSATERILIGFRPLDRSNRFSGYLFAPEDEFSDELNFVPRTLFIEGDIAELIPNVDPLDRRPLDFGFTVGRQSLLFQEGTLINTGGDGNPDAVGLVRDTLQFAGISNMRVSALYAWNNVFRDDNAEDEEAELYGLFTESDLPFGTVDVDLVFIESDSVSGDAFFAGVRAVQRIGHVNTTFIVDTSVPTERETPQTSRGTLLFSQASWTPPYTHNLVYVNAFWGIDEFSSAIRGPATGGPLGRTGILFAAVGLGRYGAALGNNADNSAGGSLGYQMFFERARRQLIVEFGGRKDTNDSDRLTDQGALALGGRYQHAIGQRVVAQIDTFGSVYENRKPGFGTRLEFLTKF